MVFRRLLSWLLASLILTAAAYSFHHNHIALGGATIEVEDIAVGQHEVRAYLPGYKTSRKSVEVVENENRPIDFIAERSLKRQWTFNPDGGEIVSVISTGMMIIGWTKENLCALSTDYGKPIWRRKIQGITNVLSDNQVMHYGRSDEIGALAAQTGNSLWTFAMEGRARIIGRAHGVVVALDKVGRLVGLDHHTGKLRWEMLIGEVQMEPIIAGTSVAFVDQEAAVLSVINLQTAQALWEQHFNLTEDRFFWHAPWLVVYKASEGRLDSYFSDTGFLSGSQGRLDGYPIFSNGVILYWRSWDVDLGHSISFASILSQRRNLFGSQVLRLSVPLEGAIDICPIGATLVVRDEKHMVAYDLWNGSMLWFIDGGGSARLLPFQEMVLAFSGTTLNCLDPESGATTLTWEFGDEIEVVNSDAPKNRFYVVEKDRLHAYWYSL